MNYVFHFGAILDRWPEFLYGAWRTMELTVISCAIGFVIGLVGALVRAFGPVWLRRLVGAYVEIIRNTPLLVQLYFVFFSLPLMGLRFSSYQAAILALSVHLGAYATEILRAGIEAVPAGQVEAAKSLGLTRGQIMRLVVIVPALRAVYPALTSQFILQLLGTSIVSAIAAEELTAETYVALAREAEGVAGVRLHSLILGAVAKRPLVALTYSSKVKHLARYLGLERYTVALDAPAFGYQAAARKIERALRDPVPYADTVAQIADRNLAALDATLQVMAARCR